MTDQTPVAVAIAYFDALSRGDMPSAMELFSQDVVWYQPGSNRFSGDHTGVDGVGALLGGMMEASQGTFAIAVTGPAMANGELVAVPVQFSGKRADASMDMSGVDLLTIREGKIAEVRLFSADSQSEDSFWGHP